ncbi:MAG TPA: hypothetical protein VGL60_04230 [Acidimicrobiales bacterium]
MSSLLAGASVAELVLAAALLIALAIGPTVSDRIVALNTMATQSTLAGRALW